MSKLAWWTARAAALFFGMAACSNDDSPSKSGGAGADAGGGVTGGSAGSGRGGASATGGVGTGGTAGSAVDGGEAGSDGSGGTAGSSRGGGGNAGSSASGGSGGGSGRGGASGVGGGASGSAGMAGSPTMPGDPCSVPGALACAGRAQKIRVICSNDGEWSLTGTCASHQNCDQTTGFCGTIIAECATRMGGDRVCIDEDLVTCGPDLVTVDLEATCPGICVASAAGAACAPTTCGDRITQGPAEDCDDANSNEDDGCTSACTDARCGDGFLQRGEECDDGDAVDTDACPTTCRVAYCGDGFARAGSEQCDDANLNESDGCTTRCVPPRCGDGLLRTTEECDDGNEVGGDGCSATCVLALPVELVASNYSCARMNDGSLRCWGDNEHGQLGLGNTTQIMEPSTAPVDLGTGRTSGALAGGSSHVCALLDDASLKCWGYNLYGMLGIGNTGSRSEPQQAPIAFSAGRTVKRATAGYLHTCAILSDDSVECWGNNEHGQLGLGTMSTRVDAPSGTPVAFGANRTPRLLGAGGHHTCAIMDDGSLRCWGFNERGQLGLGTTSDDAAPSATPVNLGAGRTAKAVTGGWGHTCAILDDDSLKCWGENGYGQLGLGNNAQLNAPSATSVNLGSGRTVKAVATGYGHTCALLDNGSVKCWGYNNWGQLGLGIMDRTLTAPIATTVNLGTGRSAKAIAASGYHGCAILDDDSVKCWGFNMFGQLGIGDTTNRGTDPSEMGDALPAVVLWRPPANSRHE